MTGIIGEDEKLRLTDHLLDRVLDGLSGRDGADLVDQRPDRTLFAGVLKPVRPDSSGVGGGGATPEGTALGLDFRLLPDNTGTLPRLRISPRFSVYYAVFPTLEQLRRANDVSAIAVPEEQAVPDEVDNEAETTKEEWLIEKEDGVAEALGGMAALAEDRPVLAVTIPAEDRSQQGAPTEKATPTQIVLPRVWRRRDIAVGTLTVDLPLQNRAVSVCGVTEIAAAIEEAQAGIASDPQRWRHLAAPRQGARTIQAPEALTTEEAYLTALDRWAVQPVDPPQWSASVRVDSSPEADAQGTMRVRLLLANMTIAFDPFGEEKDTVDPQTTERSLFDASVTVDVDGGTLVPFDFLLAPKDYRTNSEMPAKGMNCIAVVEAATVRTETLPVFRQPLYRTRDDLQVRFEDLDTDDPTGVLDRVASAMDDYLHEWDRFLEQPPAGFGEAEIEACHGDRDAFAEEIARFRLGVETLRRDRRLTQAFRLMNRAFSEIGRRSGGRVRAWRLFQLGFIVSQLTALAVREAHPEDQSEYATTLRQTMKEVGILWFPTGGGKTEAYLGLIATGLLFDRLRGKTRGVSTWMRFPLRMLSLQQLERLARVIAALNELRAREPSVAEGDPFAIGYFVGDANTPNSIDKRRMARFRSQEHLRDRARLLRRCPYCDDAVEIEADDREWRLKHVCSNRECFSNTSPSLGVYRGALPVVIVDTEIYRYLPSVLVGTVDKLAIAGRQKYFAHFVRGVLQRCPTHGYTSYDECMESGTWSAECKVKKSQLVRLAPVGDPGVTLLVQDELHLLREELGVFTGHYEGLLQYLGGRVHMTPKVLAATATIEAYDVQAFHIYLSRARRYPQPSWEQGESFYATSRPARQRRVYVGVLGHTRAIEEPALRSIALYLREVRRLQANPRWAAAIMGVDSTDDETVLDVLRLYDLALAYVNRKSVAGSIEDKSALLVDRAVLEPEGLGTVHSARLTGDMTLDEVGATLERIERERHANAEPRLDIVAATNLISHGVDLERINMLTVCGMPSHYAEYVQASSRAARSHPGLVFVLFKAGDPRESSQYEFFAVMHQHMDRLIEPVAVNRFASNAPEKTVPGLLAGVLLHDLSPRLYAERKIGRPLDHLPTLLTALGERPADTRGGTRTCVELAELREAMVQVIGADQPRPPASPAQVEHVRRRIEAVFDEQIGKIRRSLDPRLTDALTILTSFRDIDEGIEFASLHSAALVDRLS